MATTRLHHPPGRHHRPRRRRLAQDRGSVTVEMAGYTFLALFVLTLLVQVAVWAMADLSARSAANHALQTARVMDSTARAGQVDGHDLLAEINPKGISGVTVTVNRDADITTVTITGTALAVIPGVSLPVNVQVQAPTEGPDPAPAP